MSQFEVRVSPDKSVKVVELVPRTIGTDPIYLGPGQPSLSEYVGQLVLITSVERRPDDGFCGSGFRKYVTPPSRSAPRLLSCGLGRLSPKWPDEPFVEYLTPLIFNVGHKFTEKERLLHILSSLFTGVWSEEVTLYLGAQDVLTALRMVQAESRTPGRTSSLMHRFIPAMFELGISSAELDSFWPGADELIERAFKEYKSLQTHRATQLDLARDRLREAEVACAAAQQRHDEGARDLDALTAHYSQWRGPIEQVEKP